MAPTLLARLYNNNCDYTYDSNCGDYNSPWANYGRWILLAAIIIAAFLLFLSFSCITARRRRRRGMNPYRGTGWAFSAPPPGHGPAQYTGGAQQPGAYGESTAAPPYSAPTNQGYNYNQSAGYGPQQGYFGGQGQQNGVELQQPDSAFVRGGENVYAAPPGPPPGKTDGNIIR